MINGKNIYHSLIELYKLVFTLIPKNANTSIKWALLQTFFKESSNNIKIRNIDSFHASTISILNYIDNKKLSLLSDEYLKICVVRNPFDRLFSGWRDKISTLDKNRFGFSHACDFEKFIIKICETSDLDINRHFIPQYYFISQDYKIIPGYKILYFEKLNDEWKKLQDEFKQKFNVDLINLPLLNKSNKSNKSYREYYNYNTKNLVTQKFKKDLEIFNYVF